MIRTNEITPMSATARLTLRAATVALAIVCCMKAAPAAAVLPQTGPGALDPTFGNGTGMLTTALAGGIYPYGAALQPDGKLVVASSVSRPGDTWAFGVTRYLQDGTLDAAFGDGGTGIYPHTLNDGPGGFGAAIGPNGRILVIGFSQPDSTYRCTILALDAAGHPDAGFGSNGYVDLLPTAGGTAQCNGAVVQPDGRIVVIGSETLNVTQSFAARLLPDGRMDASFNGTGLLKLPLADGFYAKSLTLLPDGVVLASGATANKPHKGVLVRIRADGTLDPAFADGGRYVTAAPGTGVDFYASAIAADGRIVVAGYRGDLKVSPLVARFSASGVPDASFGNAGYLDFAIDGNAGFARSIVVQRDGKYLLEARVVLADKSVHYTIVRMLPGGALDPSFGQGGASVLPSFIAASKDYNYGMVVGPDEKIWVAGNVLANGTGYSGIARLLGDEVRTPIVEFYNTTLNHYFITADPAEAGAIDAGAAGPGWSRTGEAWNSGGPDRVCRFYGSPELDPATGLRKGPNGHFYTISSGECAQVKQDAGWKFESYDFSGWPMAAGATCPAGTLAVKRAYNNRFAVNDSNHRYATSDAIYEQMIASGWSGEGTVFCAPE